MGSDDDPGSRFISLERDEYLNYLYRTRGTMDNDWGTPGASASATGERKAGSAHDSVGKGNATPRLS